MTFAEFFEKGIFTSELNILSVDKFWEGVLLNFHFGIKFFQNSTDTYMIYDQIFTVHTTHTHTHTSVTIIFYIYKPIGPAALVSVNNCLLLFFYY